VAPPFKVPLTKNHNLNVFFFLFSCIFFLMLVGKRSTPAVRVLIVGVTIFLHFTFLCVSMSNSLVVWNFERGTLLFWMLLSNLARWSAVLKQKKRHITFFVGRVARFHLLKPRASIRFWPPIEVPQTKNYNIWKMHFFVHSPAFYFFFMRVCVRSTFLECRVAEFNPSLIPFYFSCTPVSSISHFPFFYS